MGKESDNISSTGNNIAGAIAQVGGNQQKIQDESGILTELQAASYLGISESELTSLLKNSKAVDGKGIPYFKIGNTVLFSKTALANWVVFSAENNYEY